MVSVMNYLKDYKEKDPFKILKAFNVNKDFEKIISDYFSTKRDELIKELLQREEKVQKAYSNAERIMAMDGRREVKN